MKLRKIIQRNHAANKLRGQIHEKSEISDFYTKLDEEVAELKISKGVSTIHPFNPEEAVDVILVVCSLLHHFGYNTKFLLQKKMLKNETRAAQEKSPFLKTTEL